MAWGGYSRLAQLVEHRSYEPKVTGSRPVLRKRAGSSPAGGAIASYFKATCDGGDDDRHYDHGVHYETHVHFYSPLSSVGRAQDF